MDIQKNIEIIFTFGCLVFVVLGIYICAKELLKRKRCESVITAKVVDIYRKSRSGKRFLYPVFEYNVLGNTYVEKHNVGARFCKYHIGQEIEINYNSNKPEEFYIKGDRRAIFGGLIAIVIGILGVCEINF